MGVFGTLLPIMAAVIVIAILLGIVLTQEQYMSSTECSQRGGITCEKNETCKKPIGFIREGVTVRTCCGEACT